MAASWQPSCSWSSMVDAPNVEQLLSSPDNISDAAKEQITKYADSLVSTCNPAVLPDGSNIDDAPAPKTDPHICIQVYGDIQDFDQDLTDLIATCQRHTRAQLHTACAHVMDVKSVALAIPSLSNRTQTLS